MPLQNEPPRGPWGKTWVLALFLVGMQVVGLEVFWRRRGHQPMVTANEQLWSYHRDRLVGAGLDTIALLGGSRMQIGFAMDAFREEKPGYELVQLAVPAQGAFAALRDLSVDESFRGRVICAMEEVAMQPFHLEDQELSVSYWRNRWGPGKKVSLLISAAIESRLAQLQPRLGGRDLLIWLAEGRLPLVAYAETKFDRSRVADYTKVDVESLIDTRVSYIRREVAEHPPATPEEWTAIVSNIRCFVGRIHARGGKVVIVKFPLKGRLLELEREVFPGERYWGPLSAGAGTDVIHYEEMPAWQDLVCPDDSHLDPASAERFTRWLARELTARGFLD